MPFGPLETNTLLFACAKTKRAAVVDPARGVTRALLNKVQELSLAIEKIFLTHSHWDHIADAHFLIEETHVPIYVHPEDAKNLQEPGSDGLPLLFPIQGVAGAHDLHHGDRCTVGELSFEVIHTPGHSPGSVCFFFQKEKVLLSGDTLFKGSIGNIRLATSDASRMRDSLRLLKQLPLDTRVVPGHGPDTTLKQEEWLYRADFERWLEKE